MKENKVNKNKVSVIVAIITVVIFCVGITYAYFTATVTGNEDAKSTRVTSGKLIIDFETTEYINNLTGELIKDSQKEDLADYSNFTVKHNVESKNKADYTLSLTDIEISDNLKSADFKWELVKNNTVINSGDFSSIGNSTSLNLTLDMQRLEVNQTDNYTFRIWLSETNVDQSNLYNGTFSAKIALVARSA